MELKDRIVLIRKNTELTQKQFGERIGVAANTVTNYENGIRTPMEQTIKFICREFGIDEDWLRSGNGEMFSPMSDDEKIAQYVAKFMDGKETDEKKLLLTWLQLTDEERSAFTSLVRKFADTLNS